MRVVDHASEPLILVLMMMRCLRNSGFDRPNMAKSFVIRDPKYEMRSPNCTSMLHIYIQWQMVSWVSGDSHEFGLRPADLELI